MDPWLTGPAYQGWHMGSADGAGDQYAERMHAGQQRLDGAPFILHPREVTTLLYYAGAPDHVIAAGAMQDLLEKTDATASDLQQRFGQRITELVLAVTDDDRIVGYAKRKAALRQQVAGAGEEALTLFAADKLSKLRELRRETDDEDDRGRRHTRSGPPVACTPPPALSALAGATRGTPTRIAARA